MRAKNFAAFALVAVLSLGFSGCGLIRLITGTQVRVQNDTDATLSLVGWGGETIASEVAPNETTEYISTNVTSGTITVVDKSGVIPPYYENVVWEADYAGVYVIRVQALTKLTFDVQMIPIEGKVGRR